MLKSAKIRGFQSHEETQVFFSPNLTCIIGATDSGKSALLRAPRLVIENKPSGNEFIRNGFDTTDVALEFDDTVVSRTKGTTNSYTVDGETLKAFGQSVPDTASAKMRIDPTLCIQRQSSPYFLLGNTEAERAKLVDSFCDISIASLSVAKARTNALRADKQADTLRKSLAPLKAKQTALNAFCENKPLVSRIEAGVSKLETAEKGITKLTELITRRNKTNGFTLVDGIDNTITESVTVISALVLEYKHIIETITKLVDFSKKLSFAIPEYSIDFSDIVADIGTLNATDIAISKISCWIKILSKPIPSFDVDLEPTKLLITELTTLVDNHLKMCRMVAKVNELAKGEVANAISLTKIESELKAFPNCPLCGSELCDNH